MIPGQWRLVTPPAREPVTVDDLKAQLRIDSEDEDLYLEGLLTSARQWAEGFLRRPLLTQTWEVTLDQFPASALYLPLPPVQSVSSLTYLDTLGATGTLLAVAAPPVAAVTLCQVDVKNEPARLFPLVGEVWPQTQWGVPNAVTLQFVCGYGLLPSTVPATIRQGILVYAAKLYEHREGVSDRPLSNVPGSTEEALLWPFRFFG